MATNPHVAEAIQQLLKLDAQGAIPKNAPISFSFDSKGSQQVPSTDEEYEGESLQDPNEETEIEVVPEGKVGVVPEEPVDEDESPMLAHVLRSAAVPVKPEPRRYSNGAPVTAANQRKPGLPPAPARR